MSLDPAIQKTIPADTYTGAAALLEVDFHYQQDALGSKGELAK